MSAVKTNWLGGMTSMPDPSKINFDSAYYLGVNIRTRANTCKGVKAPRDITSGLPAGLRIQGIYTFDTTVVVFASGGAYYKLANTENWVQISGFTMSATAETIDCALVPASTVNFTRTAPSTTTQTDNAVVLANPIAASPQCLICMDGETQPRIIFPDATNRITQTYAQWTLSNPEYVPIARLPLYANGVLYCIGRDLAGNWTQIYHSVTGQPLNFVILVNKQGGKISDSESEGGAPALSWRASFGSTTAIAPSNAAPGAFTISTLNATFLVTPNYDSLIAAEPTANYTYLFDVGAVGKNAIVDVLGDTTIVCRSGVRSFNGVQQLKWQGKNAPFSQPVNNFIAAQEQTVTATIAYDDYAFYALSTKYGPGILVYDFLQQAFVSIDIYDNVGLIEQFAKVQSGVSERLFFYTTDNRIFEAFVGGNQRHEVVLADLVPGEVFASHRVVEVNAVFTTVVDNGAAEALVYTDRVFTGTSASRLVASAESFVTPGSLPFNTPLGADQCQQLTFNFQDSSINGYRATVAISWNCDAELLNVQIQTAENTAYAHSVKETVVPLDAVELVHIANDHNVNDARRALNEQIQLAEPSAVISSGNNADWPGDLGFITTDVDVFWGAMKRAGKWFSTPGVNELGTVNGEPFYRYLQQGPSHYSVRGFGEGVVNVYFLTSGYDLAGNQVEPSNLDGATIATSSQFTWLRLQLAASTAAYNIVCMYDTIASSQPGVIARFTDIPFRSWGVDLVLTGAGGIYERLVSPEGLTVINNPCGSGELYDGAVTASPYTRRIVQGQLGYVAMSVTALRLNAKFVSSTNTVLDVTNL